MFDDERKADSVARAVQVDNYEFVKTVLKGNKVISFIKAKSISSLLHTLDDFLACISVAERVFEECGR